MCAHISRGCFAFISHGGTPVVLHDGIATNPRGGIDGVSHSAIAVVCTASLPLLHTAVVSPLFRAPALPLSCTAFPGISYGCRAVTSPSSLLSRPASEQLLSRTALSLLFARRRRRWYARCCRGLFGRWNRRCHAGRYCCYCSVTRRHRLGHARRGYFFLARLPRRCHGVAQLPLFRTAAWLLLNTAA